MLARVAAGPVGACRRAVVAVLGSLGGPGGLGGLGRGVVGVFGRRGVVRVAGVRLPGV